jgi:hypothetical protein
MFSRVIMASAIALSLGFGVTLAHAGGNTADVEQYGYKNQAGGGQSGHKNRLRIFQDGSRNTAISTQQGSRNRAVVGQQGRWLIVLGGPG